MTPHRKTLGVAAVTLAAVVSAVLGSATPAGAAASAPNLAKAVSYLTSSTNLVHGTRYEPFGPGFVDYGLTMDGAFALAAAGTADPSLAKITDFVARYANGWTGIGTDDVSGGSLAKEALLAQVTGNDPTAFGGHDLMAALRSSVCTAVSTPPDVCPAVGAYMSSSSVFSQALGVLAQLRAGDTTAVTSPETYLESLQLGSGAWPSLVPPGTSPDPDVDSTAMAAMALAADPGATAQAAVTHALSWLHGKQLADGGFPGTAGDSTNSAGLAAQALALDRTTYQTDIDQVKAFLAGVQNKDGGFDVASDQTGSDIRASAQAVGGALATPFTTLTRDISAMTPTDITVTMKKLNAEASPVTSASAVRLSWTVVTNAAPIASYDVYVRRGSLGHAIPGAWTRVNVGGTSRSYTLGVHPGETLVASVRARDTAGHLSGFAPMSGHVSVLVGPADMALTKGEWTKRSDAYSTTHVHARATVGRVSHLSRVFVAAATGVHYGAAALYIGGTKVTTLDFAVTSAAKSSRDHVFTVRLTASQTRQLSGRLSLHVRSSGKTVRLVGLGARR